MHQCAVQPAGRPGVANRQSRTPPEGAQARFQRNRLCIFVWYDTRMTWPWSRRPAATVAAPALGHTVDQVSRQHAHTQGCASHGAVMHGSLLRHHAQICKCQQAADLKARTKLVRHLAARNMQDRHAHRHAVEADAYRRPKREKSTSRATGRCDRRCQNFRTSAHAACALCSCRVHALWDRTAETLQGAARAQDQCDRLERDWTGCQRRAWRTVCRMGASTWSRSKQKWPLVLGIGDGRARAPQQQCSTVQAKVAVRGTRWRGREREKDREQNTRVGVEQEDGDHVRSKTSREKL